MEKTLCLIFASLLLGHAYVIRRAVGTWVFPACLNSLFWFLICFIPLIVVFDAPVNPLAILFILVSCVAFSLPAAFLNWRRAFAINARLASERYHIYRSGLLDLGFFASILISVVFWVIYSVTQGFSVASMMGDLMRTAQDFMAARYEQNVTSNIFSMVANVLGYIGSVLGGLIYRNYKSKLMKFTIIALALLPSIFVMLVQSSKGMLFLCMAFMFAGVLLHRLNDGKARLFERRIKPRTALLYFAILFPIVTASFLSRGLYTNSDMQVILDGLLKYYVSYSCAQIYAFSDWFSFYIGQPHMQDYTREPPAYGFFTFMSIVRWLGSSREPIPGVYGEYFTYGDYILSNIYTHFRGLIQDYGLVFSQVVMVLAGLVSHLAFHNVLTKRFAPISASVFVLMMGYIYTSFIISLLIWNSIYGTFGVLVLALLINGIVVARHRAAAPAMPGGVAPAHT